MSTSTYTAYVFQIQRFVSNVVKNPKRSNLASIVLRSEFYIKNENVELKFSAHDIESKHWKAK